MYEKYKQGGQIVLWCDGRPEDEASSFSLSGKRKRDDERSTRRQEQEDEVEKAFERLKDKHGDDEFDIPRLRLWSRMICSGLHDDYNVPPKIPAFSIGLSKKSSAKAQEQTIASPSKVADLRMKNLQQLRCLQQLFQDQILTSDEYDEQKSKVINALRKLD